MDQILLTADQVVVYDNKILEKPQNKEEARVFMEGYGLLPCSTVGSIVLTDLASKKRVQGVDICNIYILLCTNRSCTVLGVDIQIY